MSFAEAEFEAIVERAGEPGMVTVGNMQLARGVDFQPTEAAQALGGVKVHVTARSARCPTTSTSRPRTDAGRGGQPGSVDYYISPEDDLFQLSNNPSRSSWPSSGTPPPSIPIA